MKRLLSLVMATLFLFLNCGVRGYDVTFLPDGGKKITYTYDELQQLSERHKQLLAQVRAAIASKSQSYRNIKIVSSIASVICMIVGAVMWADNTGKDNNTGAASNDGSVIPGIMLCVLGALGLIGVPAGLHFSMGNLQDQEQAINSRIFVIDATKQRVESHILNHLVTEADAKRDFYYSLFVDSQGFVYQIERGGASVSYEIMPLEVKYKFDGLV